MHKGINKQGTADFIFNLSPCGKFLFIVDLDIFENGISVTHDMRNVIKYIANEGYPLYKLKVIYLDTQAVFDAVLINKDNTFHSIAPLNVMGIETAKKKYDERIYKQKLR